MRRLRFTKPPQLLSDARRGQGKRYELALILCLLVLAKLAGETSLSGATEWIRHRAAFLAAFFVRLRSRAALWSGTEPFAPQGRADHAHLTIDGKTLRATSSQPHPVHQLRCYARRHRHRLMALQCAGERK